MVTSRLSCSFLAGEGTGLHCYRERKLRDSDPFSTTSTSLAQRQSSASEAKGRRRARMCTAATYSGHRKHTMTASVSRHVETIGAF